jgi:hypothetical protein
MLFVGRAESSRVAQLARVARVARQRGILLVTDFEGALDEGSAINLLVLQNRVRSEVSLDAADRADSSSPHGCSASRCRSARRIKART